jgi:phosphoglycolate phosphatase
MTPRAILFDLDGTLIDQFQAIHRAFSLTLEKMGFPPPSFETVKKAVGGASISTMTKLIGPERAKEAVDILRPIFEEEMLNGLILLPGAKEILLELKECGIKSAVLTNKYGPHAREVCRHLGLDEFLEFTLGANDTEWKKPNPKLTQFALDKIKSTAEDTIYIGDSPYDYQTAKNASMDYFLTTTGTHSEKELSRLGDGIKIKPNLLSILPHLIV